MEDAVPVHDVVVTAINFIGSLVTEKVGLSDLECSFTEVNGMLQHRTSAQTLVLDWGGDEG